MTKIGISLAGVCMAFGQLVRRSTPIFLGVALMASAFVANAAGPGTWSATLVLAATNGGGTYSGTGYANKNAAIAAMKNLTGFPSEGADLTQERPYSTTATTITYQYVAPPVAETFSPWVYSDSAGQDTGYSSESALIAANTAACTLCPCTYTPAGSWTVYPGYPPMPYDYFDQRNYTIANQVLNAQSVCVPGSTNTTTTIYRTRQNYCPGLSDITQVSNGICLDQDIGYVSGPINECPANGSPSTSVGDPCDVSTGDFSQTESDYSGAGLIFQRYYHSVTLESSHTLGVGWTHNYAASLLLASGGPTGLLRPNGHHDALTTSTAGVYISLSGAAIHVQQSGANWIATLKDGSSEVYNSAGQLIQLVTPGGLITTLTYNSNNQLSAVSDPFGHSLQFGYNTNNQINQVIDPAGHTIAYAYDTNNNLTSATYQDSTVRTYLYENSTFPNNLTGILDESNSRLLTVGYDSTTGAVKSSQQAGGAQAVSIVYNTNTAVVTDSLGAINTYTFTTDAAFAPRVNAFSRNSLNQSFTVPAGATDPQRRVTQSVDANGNITTYAFDADHLTSKTEAYGTANARTTSYQYLATSSALPTLVTEPLRQTSYVYYPGTNNVHTKTVTDTTVTPNVSRTWTYTYNGYGQALTIDGPRTDVTDVTTIAYYTCTTGNQCGQVNTITNALNQITTFNTYNAYGQPLTITDPNGILVTLTYDARQRLKSRQVGTETTSYSYYPTGLLDVVTLPDGSTIQYGYDGAHRLTDITDGLGNHIHYTLDAMGNRTAENTYDPSSTLRRTHTRVINALNELYEDISAAGTPAVTTTFGYDNNGNQTSIAAPLSRNTGKTYDALNRLSQITDPANGITQLGYDANNSLVSVKDPRSLTTSYSHNGFGDVATLVSPDTGTTTNTYDSGGNLNTSTDARGAVGTYSYDALNRVTQIAYTDQTINFTYDAGTNGKGRLTGASDAHHTLSWVYDTLGRVTGKSQIVNAVTESVGYGYTNGDMTSLVTPSGQTVIYGYTNHRITSITVNSTALLSGVTYDPFGPANGWTWGNSTTVSRTYDTDGKISVITTAADPIDSSYDNAFRITGITDTTTPANNWMLNYDLLDRLTSASEPGTNDSWTYDANGNRLTQTGPVPTTYNISSTSNLLSSSTGATARTYTYDAAGNAKSWSNDTFTYSNRGRMSSATVGSTTNTYVYNALGQMIEKTAGSNTLFMYDEAGHLLGEYSNTGALIEETIWMGDIPVATLRPNGSTVSVYYVHTDQTNTPRKITRPSDDGLMWRWDTDPFGTIAPNQSPAGLGTFIYNLRFPGQYDQVETGLVYNYFRDYMTSAGRYIESDPIGLLGGINTYAYVDDDPVSGSDPLGLVQYDKPNPNIGTIICNGSGGIDVQFPANISPMAEKCLGDCLRAHEISHISDIRRLGPGACKGQARGVIPTFDTQAQLLASERKAYDVELACLQKKLQGMSDCDECKKWVQTRIKTVTQAHP